MITWHFRAPIARRQMSKIYHIHHSPKTVTKNVFAEFKGTSDELADKLRAGFGGQISIQYIDSNGGENIDFKYAKASFPKMIDFSKVNLKKQAAQKPVGYVRVYSRYWEQMTMNVRSAMGLAGQAKIGGRAVLEPRVKDSVFNRVGRSLGIYFDLGHLNKILATGGYSTFANENEYNKACSSTNASHVNIHFLYPQKAIDFTKDKLKLNDKEYKEISTKASKTGWTECKALSNFIKENPKSKQYCVDPSKFTKWEKLEKDVIKGAKCLTIATWRGIGGGFRTYFSENEFKIKSRDIQFALKPSQDILNEVMRFKKRFLSGRYIAVQVRGERVVIPHSLNRLRSCLRLLAEAVGVLKTLSDITEVFIASDMSDFGSGSWKGSLKGEVYNENTLKDLHSFLVSSTGGIEYKPGNVDNIDHGVVALTEMNLIAQAQHLITIGTGSFQEWIKARFLDLHRNEERPLWSLTTMCSI